MSDIVLFEKADGVALVTLNRPEKLNALSYRMIDALMFVLDGIETDDEVGAIILTGAGNRAFSAGGDIVEFSNSVACGGDVAIRDFVRRGQTMTSRIEAFPKPIIVAVNGLAFGGGCEITEAAHLAVAADDALFAKPEIRLGMPPTFGGTQRLPRLAGRKRALELLLTGKPFSAARALELGLVNHVVARDRVLGTARALAKDILRHSPLAVRAILTAATRGLNLSIGEGLLVESEQFAQMIPTRDLAHGLESWKTRRADCPRKAEAQAACERGSSARIV